MTTQVPATFAEHRLEVGDGHTLYVREIGSPAGVPVVWLHGGPGTGCGAGAVQLFTDRHRAVLIDQRGSGRSTPHASESGVHWASIDLDHHVADLEAVREHLGIDRWVVAGGSWGSVLGAAYAQRHPDRARAVVLGPVSTGTRDEIDHLTEHGHVYAPGPWAEFHDFAQVRRPGRRLVVAYCELVMHPDPAVHDPAAYAWCRWEDAHVNVDDEAVVDGFAGERYRDPAFRVAFARQVTHCWVADSWLEPDELVHGAASMGGVPCWLVHGARDQSGPMEGPRRLAAAWPGCELIVVDDGHGGAELTAVVRRLLARARYT